MLEYVRRGFTAAVAAAVVVSWGGYLGAAEEKDRPNIVFFLIDDLGRADVGFMGCKDIHTPHIDELARSGAILNAHYVQPVCSPTRAALMTGRYATRTGVYTIVRPGAKWGLPLEEKILAQALSKVGYETAIVGKWHLGEFDRAYLPTSRGFDHQYGHYFGALDYFTHVRDGVYDWHRDDVESKDEGYTTHLISREACRLIREKDKSKPLFLYVPFNGVHSPFQVPESYMEPYAALEGNRRILAGMLSAVDEAIGQIVEALDSAGLRENTLVVFSSDNGGPNPEALSDNTPLRAGKGTIYEGGVRVCAFAHWPGKIPSGVVIDEPMHAVDWYPTLVKLAGGKIDDSRPLDGRDVWPMITRQAASPHDCILLVHSPTHAAVRMGDWKLIVNEPVAQAPARPRRAKKKAATAVATTELYNLAADIAESNNLAAKEPQRVAAMRARLDSLLRGAVAPGHLGLQDELPIPPEAKKRR